jgi:hypothetical protein
MTLLLSNKEDETIVLRVVGMLLIGLSFFVVQFIRLQVTALYPSPCSFGACFSVCLVTFFLVTLNPFFLILLIIVVFGVVITSLGLFADRKERGD